MRFGLLDKSRDRPVNGERCEISSLSSVYLNVELDRALARGIVGRRPAKFKHGTASAVSAKSRSTLEIRLLAAALRSRVTARWRFSEDSMLLIASVHKFFTFESTPQTAAASADEGVALASNVEVVQSSQKASSPVKKTSSMLWRSAGSEEELRAKKSQDSARKASSWSNIEIEALSIM